MVNIFRADKSKQDWAQQLQLDWFTMEQHAIEDRPPVAMQLAGVAGCDVVAMESTAPPPSAIARLVCARLLTSAQILPADATNAQHISVSNFISLKNST